MQKKVLRRERTWSLYCGQVRTGFGYAVSTSLHGLPPNFIHALKICLGRFLSPFRSARLIESGGNSPSSHFSWRKVWTGMNWCEVQLLFGAAPRSARHSKSSRSAELDCEISPGYDVRQKKLWLSIVPVQRPSEQPGLGPPTKRCELQLFFAGIRQAVWR